MTISPCSEDQLGGPIVRPWHTSRSIWHGERQWPLSCQESRDVSSAVIPLWSWLGSIILIPACPPVCVYGTRPSSPQLSLDLASKEIYKGITTYNHFTV